MEQVDIRGLNLLAVTNQQALLDFLISEQCCRAGKLIAINAEKVILSEKQDKLRALLDDAEFKYADGISIVKSIRKKYPHYKNIERIAGCDLWEALMYKSAEQQIPVFLVGGKAEVLNKTISKLQQRGVNIVGSQNGYFQDIEQQQIIERIKQSQAQIVTVAMGSPKQELFMQSCQQVYPNALYMGVGGTYDVFTGNVKRAPKIWQKMNLEWLYRLLSQPTRWRRQLNLLHYAYYYLCNKL